MGFILGGEHMTEELLKKSLAKSAGMLSVIPPAVAAGFTLKVVEKSFNPYFRKRR